MIYLYECKFALILCWYESKFAIMVCWYESKITLTGMLIWM
jgi:hypothetical protein